MTGSTFGKAFSIRTFGESHGVALGVIIEGVPSGLIIDMDFIQSELMRRRPGQSAIVTQRKEMDNMEVLSGVFEGVATGTPIMMVIYNKDAKSKDYSHIKDSFRPSHADYTYYAKYGLRDYRGGGRSSARETVARVAAGAIAKLWLKAQGVTIQAYVSQVGHIKLVQPYTELDLSLTETNIVRCPDIEVAAEMETYIKQIKKQGDTVGGVVSAVVQGCPIGLGEPVFDKLHAELGKAMLSINACKGFDYGSGFDSVAMLGSTHNDEIIVDDKGNVVTTTNFAGGIVGGISNGMDIYFRSAFKPVATIMRPQNSIDKAGNKVEVMGKGRHDPCVVPRAVVIVEAMAALVVADFLLRHKASA